MRNLFAFGAGLVFLGLAFWAVGGQPIALFVAFAGVVLILLARRKL